MADMSSELEPIYQQLRNIRVKLEEMKADPSKFKYDDLVPYQQALDEIDSKRVDGIFAGTLENVPAGQAACLEVMDDAYDILGELVPKISGMNPDVKRIHDELAGIKRKLLNLKTTRDFTSDTIHHYQLMVDALDCKRVNGIFGGDTQNIPPGQAECSDLLSQVYELLHQMLSVAPDMNADMRGIFHHLLGIKRKLTDMKRLHVTHSSGDLHIFQVQLAATDNNRKDGIFAGSPQTGVPAGQAVCATLLAQCYKLVSDLQETATDV